MNRCHISIPTLLALCLGPLLGCGDGRPQRVPVSGQVLIDGQPLKFGYVRFVPTGSRPSTAKLDDSGRFVLACFEEADGAVVGRHRVEVDARESLNAVKTKWHAPKKYASYQSSGLEQEVSEPIESLTIQLSWEGGKPFVETDSEAEVERSAKKR